MRRVQWLLFAAAFIAFAYFHQGGGWNQNVRFAMVRAMAERGQCSIDSYLIYVPEKAGSTNLVRLPIENGVFLFQEKSFTLMWRDARGRPFPVNSSLEGLVTAVNPTAKTFVIQLSRDANAKLAINISDDAIVETNHHRLTRDDIKVGGAVRILASIDAAGRFVAQRITILPHTSPREMAFADLADVGASGDVAFVRGHFHPNKAPGAACLAVPAYFIIYQVERLFGLNPDQWWTLTMNSWLAGVFSVGLLSALGCILFFRLALAWSGHWTASVRSTLAFAFGTMYFPYATMLYEHNLIAVALLASFYWLYRVKTNRADPKGYDSSWFWILLSGLCAGYAASSNYIVAVPVVMLGVYLVLSVKRRGGWRWFALGLLGPFLLICLYNFLCFGTPLTTNWHHQNPSMGVLILPRCSVLLAVLISPLRGLFFTAPVLLLGAYEIVPLFRSAKLRAEAWLICSIIAFFLLFISSWNQWDGGLATTSRLLLPALPFLALPMVFGFVRWMKTGCVLAVVSAAMMFVVTAVDPQSPMAVGSGTVLGRPNLTECPLAASFSYDPITEYEMPLFFTGRASPILKSLLDGYLAQYEQLLADKGITPEQRRQNAVVMRQRLEASIERGDPVPFEIASFVGPVSVNPRGMYEGAPIAFFVHSRNRRE